MAAGFKAYATTQMSLRRQVCLNVPSMSKKANDGEVLFRHYIALKLSSLYMQPYFQVAKNDIRTE